MNIFNNLCKLAEECFIYPKSNLMKLFLCAKLCSELGQPGDTGDVP